SLEINQGTTYKLFLMGIKTLTVIILPIMLILMLSAYVVMRLQVGHLWTFSTMKPKFSKLFNIMKGIKKLMISPSAFVRLARSLLQAVAVGIAPYIVIKQEYPKLPSLFFMTPEAITAYILSVGYKMACYALVPMMLIAIADLVYNRWNYGEQLKMTKDEIKDERKQMEGDPKIKAAQQQKMMAFMAKRMMESVPKADVIVTNPTHLAVALSYNVLEAPAPMVLAKGADHLAEKIKEIAKENDIPIKENKPLAQALYKQVEIGETIPEELYQAVAAILANLDKFKK
ncbi:MAG: flagellar type III secretion system protein FlhB, partial [Proteobacteria bacterium]|nr:flagellar type III secretion system protein FlhB [Pseudomonadota bacterium]